MRKRLFILLLLSCMPVFTALAQTTDDDLRQNLLRLFLNDGRTLDFNATEIDSITATTNVQRIWQPDTCHSIPLAAIDSVWYISPVLRVSMPEPDFGKVFVGSGKSNLLTITNTGNYPESYLLFAGGSFSVEGSGHYFPVQAGQSVCIKVNFQPQDEQNYHATLLLSSASVGNGLFKLPLTGEGVATDTDEENLVLQPEEQEFDIELSGKETDETLQGLKIVNAYGEFPVSAGSLARSKAEGIRRSIAYSPIPVSIGGMQSHYLTNSNGEPLLFSITLPGEKPELSVRQTAIALLMTEPLLMATNEAEYRNTVNALAKLPSFKHFQEQVRELYLDGIKHNYCPNYSALNAVPVIKELAEQVFDNTELKSSGMLFHELEKTPKEVTYQIQNNRKRVLHIYPSRVNMDPNNYTIHSQEDVTYTVAEMCEWLIGRFNEDISLLQEKIDNAGSGSEEKKQRYEDTIKESEEEIEQLKEFKQWTGEIESLARQLRLADEDTRLALPSIVDTKHSSYWKIVKGSFWDGDKSSPFEVMSDTIETTFLDNDYVFADIYGLGNFNKSWDEFSQKEKFRFLFVIMHSAYVDVVRPFIGLVTGIGDVYNATGSDNYKYDFRYGKRKYPVWELVTKLTEDLLKDTDRLQKMADAIRKKDFVGLGWQAAVFAYDRILTCANEDPNDDKRTYINLIYNIYKKYIIHKTATSTEFRKNFKEVANNLTYLKKACFIGEVVNVSEWTLDLAGTLYASTMSNAKETFMVAHYDQTYIEVVQPTGILNTTDQTVHFEWTTYKADISGHFLYDLELLLETPDGITQTIAKSNIDGNSYDLNLSSVPGAANALKIHFRIIMHAPEHATAIYCMSDVLPLVSQVKTKLPVFKDLGLPSGTLWADCNMGTTQAEAAGNHYAWGDIDTAKGYYSWDSYRYADGANNKLTKYCTKSFYGKNNFTDNRLVIEGYDDPVSSAFGCFYSTPTKEEWEELLENCTCMPLDNGVLVSGNGESIFLPTTGYRSGYDMIGTGSDGYYWSSTLDKDSPDDAWYVHVANGRTEFGSYYRCQGRCIRPVQHKIEFAPPITSQQ